MWGWLGKALAGFVIAIWNRVKRDRAERRRGREELSADLREARREAEERMDEVEPSTTSDLIERLRKHEGFGRRDT